jgi:hypothetical protein
LTVKRFAIRQTGETCRTVKTTVAARLSVKVRVVWRLRFGPVVAIHVRDDLTPRRPERSGPPSLEEPALSEEDDPFEPFRLARSRGDPLAPVTAGDASVVAVVTAPAGAVVCKGAAGKGGTVGVVTGAGGGAGAGDVGTGSVGTVTVGTVTVGTVTGGTGTTSARTGPARSPAPTSTVVTAAARIPGQLPSG